MQTIALIAVAVVIAVTVVWGALGVRRANEGRDVERDLRQRADREPTQGFVRRGQRPTWSAPRAA